MSTCIYILYKHVKQGKYGRICVYIYRPTAHPHKKRLLNCEVEIFKFSKSLMTYISSFFLPYHHYNHYYKEARACPHMCASNKVMQGRYGDDKKKFCHVISTQICGNILRVDAHHVVQEKIVRAMTKIFNNKLWL